VNPSSADARYRPYEVALGARRARTRGQRWTTWAEQIARRRIRSDGRHGWARPTTVLGRSSIAINSLSAVYKTANATHVHLAVKRYEQLTSPQPTRRGTVVTRSDPRRGHTVSARVGRGGLPKTRPSGSEVSAVGAGTRVIAVARATRAQSGPPVIGELVQRVIRRAQRIEVTDTSRRVTRARVDVMAEVARVLTAPEAIAGTDGPARGSTPLRSPVQAAAPSPFDIESLTDHIVTRLDDRLTAHRERFGRAV
jgi:hypothetical protein